MLFLLKSSFTSMVSTGTSRRYSNSMLEEIRQNQTNNRNLLDLADSFITSVCVVHEEMEGFLFLQTSGTVLETGASLSTHSEEPLGLKSIPKGASRTADPGLWHASCAAWNYSYSIQAGRSNAVVRRLRLGNASFALMNGMVVGSRLQAGIMPHGWLLSE